MRILIAEDDLTSRMLLSRVLQQSGYEVVEVENGAQALALLEQPGAPRMAILDWVMPELEGPEVVRRIRARPPTDRPPYLIMLTTRGQKSDVVAGLAAGANDYLTKPFNPGELHARVAVGWRMIKMQDTLAAKVEELAKALEQIKTLRGIVPICANCKKIRDDQGFWNQVEAYISQHSEARFSHGICPECVKKLYPWYQPGADKSGTQSGTPPAASGVPPAGGSGQ